MQPKRKDTMPLDAAPRPAPGDDALLSLAQEAALPVEQARRCLDRWLDEESRHLPEGMRKRASALMARYFLYEDNVTDELLMSFLRHYAGFRVIDMDDPASVRAELKTVLDQSVAREPPAAHRFSARHYIFAAAVFGFLLMAVLLWQRPSPPINAMQERALKERVEKITALDPSLRAVTVWARLRAPFGIARYKQLTAAQYPQAQAMLDKWIADLEGGAGKAAIEAAP